MTGVGLTIRKGAAVMAGNGGRVRVAVALRVAVASGKGVAVGKIIIVGKAAGGKLCV
jgi:hypothetical protein